MTDLKDIMGILLAMLLCGLIVWLAYRFSRMLAGLSGGRFRTRYLREVDRLATGTESRISLLQCGKKYYLVGIGKQEIRLLAELDEETLQELPRTPADPAVPGTAHLKESEFLQKLKSGLSDRRNKYNDR